MKRIEITVATLAIALASMVGKADELRDPTRPAALGPGIVMAAPGVEAVRLEAILSAGDGRRAIVNGKVVREGDRVVGVQIVTINENSIHYVRAGRGHIASLSRNKLSLRGPAALHAGEP